MDEAKQKLALAERKAKQLFDMVERLGLIAPGKYERELIAEVVALAKQHFGIEQFWHKKIIRAGVNTLQPYSGNPPDLVIQDDDMVILDFGPIYWQRPLKAEVAKRRRNCLARSKGLVRRTEQPYRR
jgi:Xaa-Pro aminopeptidase